MPQALDLHRAPSPIGFTNVTYVLDGSGFVVAYSRIATPPIETEFHGTPQANNDTLASTAPAKDQHRSVAVVTDVAQRRAQTPAPLAVSAHAAGGMNVGHLRITGDRTRACLLIRVARA